MIRIESLGGNAIKVTAPATLKADDFAQLAPQAERIIGEYGALRLLIDASALTGWENAAALESHAAFVKDHQQKVDRIAVVTAHDWQRWLVGAVRVFLHPKTKVFARDEENNAIKWLLGRNSQPFPATSV